MKRSGFARKVYAPPVAPLVPVVGCRGVLSMSAADPITVTRESAYRSEAWRRAVAQLPCANCFKEGSTQAAHPNHRNKGMATKADDCWCVPLCIACHQEFDQGKSYTKQERRERFDEWLIQTIKALAVQGLVKPA